MAHALLITGDREAATKEATHLACTLLGTTDSTHPDLLICSYDLLSVDDARELARLAANTPVAGEHKAFVIQASRIFHEAQNALLKLFEEPPAGTHLYLLLPHAGGLLPTLRSRLLIHNLATVSHDAAQAFVSADQKERARMVAKIIDRAKSDKESEKQEARAEAEMLLAGLVRVVHKTPRSKETLAFLEDASRFGPILATRSAPLKQIFEHILLTFPERL